MTITTGDGRLGLTSTGNCSNVFPRIIITESLRMMSLTLFWRGFEADNCSVAIQIRVMMRRFALLIREMKTMLTAESAERMLLVERRESGTKTHDFANKLSWHLVPSSGLLAKKERRTQRDLVAFYHLLGSKQGGVKTICMKNDDGNYLYRQPASMPSLCLRPGSHQDLLDIPPRIRNWNKVLCRNSVARWLASLPHNWWANILRPLGKEGSLDKRLSISLFKWRWGHESWSVHIV